MIGQTTAHTLCFTFGLLALYQDEQEKLYKHIKTIIPNGEIPVRLRNTYTIEHLPHPS